MRSAFSQVWPTLVVVGLFLSALMLISILAFSYESTQVVAPSSVDGEPALAQVRSWEPPGWSGRGRETVTTRPPLLGCQQIRQFDWQGPQDKARFFVDVVICNSERTATGAIQALTMQPVEPSATVAVHTPDDAVVARGWTNGNVGYLAITTCDVPAAECDASNVADLTALSARTPPPPDTSEAHAARRSTMTWGAFVALGIPGLGIQIARIIRQRGIRQRYPKLRPRDTDVAFVDVARQATRSQARRNAHHTGRFITIMMSISFGFHLIVDDPSLFPKVFYFFWVSGGILWWWGHRDPRAGRWAYAYRSGASDRAQVGRGWITAARIGFVLFWISEALLLIGLFFTWSLSDLSWEVAVLQSFARSPTVLRTPGAMTALLLTASRHGFVFLDIALVGSLPLLNLAFRHGRRLQAASAKEVEASGYRPYFLLLRSFDEDGAQIPTEYIDPGLLPRPLSLIQTLGFEEVLTQGLSRFGPVYAINPPGNTLPELGAAKMTLTDFEWRDKVKDYSAGALAIVVQVTPGKISREGFGWELDYLRREAGHERIVAVLGPWPPADKLERWNRFRSSVVGGPLSELADISQPGGLRIAARSESQGWRLFGGDETKDSTYLQAIQAALDACGPDWREELASTTPRDRSLENRAPKAP